MNSPSSAPMNSASIRPISEDDLLDLTDMFARCSRQTIYRRFHGHVRAFPEPYFTDAIKGDPHHFALVAETPGKLVAMASCVELDDGTCEIGILIEDDCQRQHLGTRLLETLLDHAGSRAVRATIQHDQSWIIPTLARYNKIRINFS
jgi:GNAT superfamily N-acetyltransferase